jgi:hypothetical protein
MQQSVASAATTAPADQSAADRLQAYVQEQSLPAAGGQATTDQTRKSDFALQAAPSATAPVAANREVYLARDMTRAQLNALRQSLAQDDSHPTVMVYDQPPIASGTTTGWGGMAFNGPAQGQGGQANWSAAATTKPVRDALAPDALAMTTAPSEPLARTWAVPATQPAEPQAKTARAAASQPGDGGLLERDADVSPATNPATAPAPALTQQNAPLQMQATPLEEKRDVVILVLKAPAASAENPATATQPALVPESMPAPATQPTSQPVGPADLLAR